MKKSGFTLIETLVAISIFTISILGLLSVLTQGVINSKYARQKIVASYLAQEGIEYVRNMRDTYVLYDQNFSQFKNALNNCNGNNNNDACGFNIVFPHVVTRCDQISNCKLYVNASGGYDTVSSGTDSGFTRRIWKENIGSDQIKIHSDVSWTQGSGNYNVTFAEDLFDWVE
jgi:prepilin-type N-terminal cleavage/methylation domain-containing protein